ncbi:MAG: PhoH family protein [Phycisphaerales bacterium]|nr:PhoH family protein [Phycisphaerales bacterium]
MKKNYVLDANILLHDPNSIFQFADNTVIIPIGVISEIDRFKKERTDRGYNARAVVRLLDGLRGRAHLTQGIPLDNGGQLRVYCEPGRALANGNGHADIEILRVSLDIQKADPQTPVIIVTKDINLRIRGEAAGLRAEDYESDHVMLAELDTGQAEYLINTEQLEEFRSTGQLELSSPPFGRNEYILLRLDNGGKSTALARMDPEGQKLIALRHTDGGLWGIRPRNKEQYFAIDAMLDERINLVTLRGKAGTGKTLLAIAAAIHMVLREKQYRGVLIARPVFPLGRDLGYLPGDLGQKLDPWMKPVVDTLELLLDTGGSIRGFADGNNLLNSNLIEVQPLTYIRGRNIANRFVVIDETQNLTPLEVKTVITRIGQGAKIILTGDPYQIDNPYLDGSSNGFTYLINRFRSQAIAAHVELRKGERSPLAELSANLL